MFDNLITPKSSRDKIKKFDESVSNFFADKEIEDLQNKQDVIFKEEYNREKIAMALNESYERKVYENLTSVKQLENEKKKCFIESIPVLFASLVYASLPLDEYCKNENASYIYQKASGYYKSLSELGIIQFKKDSIFTTLCEEIAVAFSDNNDGTEYTIDTLMKKIKDENPYDTDYIIKNVTDKVVNAVKREKEAIIIKEKLIKEDKYVDENDKSLFRIINEKCISKVLKEDKDLANDDEKLFNKALFESIIDYTILEMAHTAQLIEIDYVNLKKNKKTL